MKTFIIDTSDTRMFYTMKFMRERNFTVFSKDSYQGNLPCIYCFSPQKRFTLEELNNLNSKSELFCGKLPNEQKTILNDKTIQYHNLLEDEIFAIDNAILTAEGALMLIIRGTNISIFRMKIAILGYGRLGKAISTLLKGLGVDFSIFSNDYYERSTARLCNTQVFDLKEDLKDFDVIVNTVPAKILSLGKLESTKKSCYILDLASFSSVEICDVNSLGLAYDNALGIPGKYSPKTAGEILAEAILRNLEV